MTLTTWTRSSFCSAASCVAVLVEGSTVLVRDTKAPEHDGPVLSFSLQEWEAFVAGVKIGEFDLAPSAQV
jgi:hypothetical protein